MIGIRNRLYDLITTIKGLIIKCRDNSCLYLIDSKTGNSERLNQEVVTVTTPIRQSSNLYVVKVSNREDILHSHLSKSILLMFLFGAMHLSWRTCFIAEEHQHYDLESTYTNRKQSDDEILQQRCTDMWTQPSERAHLSPNNHPTICRSKNTHTTTSRVPSQQLFRPTRNVKVTNAVFCEKHARHPKNRHSQLRIGFSRTLHHNQGPNFASGYSVKQWSSFNW